MNEFTGFSAPESNYCKIPNLFFELMADGMKECELKVTLYILRHTWGYQEFDEAKRITLDEFLHGRKRRNGTRIDNGCGLKSKTSVLEGLEKAIDRGTIIIESDDSDKARKERYYAIKMKSDVQNLNIENSEGDVQNLNLCGTEFEHRTEKDTTKRQSIKDKKESASATLGDVPAKADDTSPVKDKTPKTKEKSPADEIFEIISLGSFGKPYAELNGNSARAGKIRKEILKLKPDITPEYLKSGYQLYLKENPDIKHNPKNRLKSPMAIIDKCEQAQDLANRGKPAPAPSSPSELPDYIRKKPGWKEPDLKAIREQIQEEKRLERELEKNGQQSK